MTYPEAVAWLGESRRFGAKPGLGPMRALAAALGDPQERLRFIHLAGTNGKGSTAAFLESALRAGGFRTGLYTSPHLVSVRERVQVGRVPVTPDEFASAMAEVRAAAERVGGEITFFERITALALVHFARSGVDWVVWETGLGGRLDATNIVRPEACVITNIGLDHQRYLGGTLAEIAGEKAGIFKPGVPAVTAAAQPEVLAVLERRAAEMGAPLERIGPGDAEDRGLRGLRQAAWLREPDRTVELGLPGPHQVPNAACAVAALRLVAAARPDDARLRRALAPETLAESLAATRWPGRFEILSERPFRVLDGAHNRPGLEALVAAWRVAQAARGADPDRKIHLVFGCVADKELGGLAEIVRPLAGRVSLVRLANERSADPRELRSLFPGLPGAVYEAVPDLWRALEAEAAAGGQEEVLIAGSLFLAGEILAARDPAGAAEFTLNERLERRAAPIVPAGRATP